MISQVIPVDTLVMDRAEIYRSMGSARYVPDDVIRDRVESVIEKAGQVCKSKFGYEVLPAGPSSSTTIRVGNTEMHTGPVIAQSLSSAEYYAVFVATSGLEYEDWAHVFRSSGDIMDELIVDAVGSEIVESTVSFLKAHLRQKMAQRHMFISNSYSPGYCGWSLQEQKKLFAFLPYKPCDIELNTSCLMRPVKSVSGIIAIGSRVKQRPYGCSVCDSKDCYKKRLSR